MKVVIIDDHPLIRYGLQSLFSLDNSIEVLGEATNRKEAIQLFSETQPDIAMIDLRLGNDSGIELVKKAMQKGYKCKFVILTSSVVVSDFKKAKEIGVDGYILKEALPEELMNALHIIHRGRKYYDPSIIELMMNSHEPLEEDLLVEQLTPKEKEVLIELGMGLSNKEISKKLFITEFTVKKHVSQIFAKLGLADRTQAALYANSKGLVKYVVNSR